MPELSAILLVEDREDDVVLVRKALTKGHINTPVQVVHNGEQALAYLKGEEPYENRDEYPMPNLVLLDLRMPGMDGFEVLQWIRRQPGLSGLRVVVLTSSDEPRDVKRAYELG